MNKAIEELQRMSKAINYNYWIFNAIKKYAGENILEIGSGIGTFTQFFKNREKVIANDILEENINTLENKFHSHANIRIIKGDICSNIFVDLFKQEKIDTIICLNVLEHITDDLTALGNMHKILSHSGMLILMVPAMQCLYGTIDKVVGHVRRYKKKELKQKLIKSGFTIKSCFYINSIGALGWFLNNRILKRTEHSERQILFYDRVVVPTLSRVENFIHPPFGQSLIFICGKAD